MLFWQVRTCKYTMEALTKKLHSIHAVSNFQSQNAKKNSLNSKNFLLFFKCKTIHWCVNFFFFSQSALFSDFVTKITEYLCSEWFFSSYELWLFTWPFLTEFFNFVQRVFYTELKFEKIFLLWSFFVELWGFKDCHFGQCRTINA